MFEVTRWVTGRYINTSSSIYRAHSNTTSGGWLAFTAKQTKLPGSVWSSATVLESQNMFSHNLHKNTLKDIWFARSSQVGTRPTWWFLQVFVNPWEFPFGSGQDRHQSCHQEQSDVAFPCESGTTFLWSVRRGASAASVLNWGMSE